MNQNIISCHYKSIWNTEAIKLSPFDSTTKFWNFRKFTSNAWFFSESFEKLEFVIAAVKMQKSELKCYKTKWIETNNSIWFSPKMLNNVEYWWIITIKYLLYICKVKSKWIIIEIFYFLKSNTQEIMYKWFLNDQKWPQNDNYLTIYNIILLLKKYLFLKRNKYDLIWVLNTKTN